MAYVSCRRRLIVLGYNATLTTTTTEAPTSRLPKRTHFEQAKALAKVNPRVLQSLQELAQVGGPYELHCIASHRIAGAGAGGPCIAGAGAGGPCIASHRIASQELAHGRAAHRTASHIAAYRPALARLLSHIVYVRMEERGGGKGTVHRNEHFG